MKGLSFLITVLVLSILISGCAGLESKDGNVFIPKEVKPIEVETGSITLCKEVILNKKGERLLMSEILQKEIPLNEIDYHRFQCIESSPPFAKFTIPYKEWNDEFESQFIRVHYQQLRLKLKELDYICSLSTHTNLTCKEVINRIERLEEFIRE